jgi:hypothetical protein
MPNIEGMAQQIIINSQRDEKRPTTIEFTPTNKYMPNKKGIHSNTQMDAQQQRNSP